MKHQLIDQLHNVTSQRQLTYPLHKIVAAMARSEADEVVVALDKAGFTRDRIEVIIAEDVPELGEPIGGSELHRFLVRLRLSKGDDLDELEQARRELMDGYAPIQVLVHGKTEQERVRTVLSQHTDHAMHYFGRWTIASIDQPRVEG